MRTLKSLGVSLTFLALIFVAACNGGNGSVKGSSPLFTAPSAPSVGGGTSLALSLTTPSPTWSGTTTPLPVNPNEPTGNVTVTFGVSGTVSWTGPTGTFAGTFSDTNPAAPGSISITISGTGNASGCSYAIAGTVSGASAPRTLSGTYDKVGEGNCIDKSGYGTFSLTQGATTITSQCGDDGYPYPVISGAPLITYTSENYSIAAGTIAASAGSLSYLPTLPIAGARPEFGSTANYSFVATATVAYPSKSLSCPATKTFTGAITPEAKPVLGVTITSSCVSGPAHSTGTVGVMNYCDPDGHSENVNLKFGGKVTLTAHATDTDTVDDTLSYKWSDADHSNLGTGVSLVDFTGPSHSGNVTVTVTDSEGGDPVSDSVHINVN